MQVLKVIVFGIIAVAAIVVTGFPAVIGLFILAGLHMIRTDD